MRCRSLSLGLRDFSVACASFYCSSRQLPHLTSAKKTKTVLEVIQSLLPPPVTLDPDLYTPKYHLLTSPEIDSELHHISIINRIGSAFNTRWTQPEMIQKRARRTLHILNIPLTILAPKFTMSPTDDLGLEAYGCGGGHVCRDFGGIFTLRVAAHTNY